MSPRCAALPESTSILSLASYASQVFPFQASTQLVRVRGAGQGRRGEYETAWPRDSHKCEQDAWDTKETSRRPRRRVVFVTVGRTSGASSLTQDGTGKLRSRLQLRGVSQWNDDAGASLPQPIVNTYAPPSVFGAPTPSPRKSHHRPGAKRDRRCGADT